MAVTDKGDFQIATFLATAGLDRKTVRVKAGETFFAQGDAALSVFYLQSGTAKLTVISKRGKEATIMRFQAGTSLARRPLRASSGCVSQVQQLLQLVRQ